MNASNKSAKFAKWLESLDEEKIKRLVALEQAARLAVHQLDLVGEISGLELRRLARTAKKLQASYEGQ